MQTGTITARILRNAGTSAEREDTLYAGNIVEIDEKEIIELLQEITAIKRRLQSKIKK